MDSPLAASLLTACVVALGACGWLAEQELSGKPTEASFGGAAAGGGTGTGGGAPCALPEDCAGVDTSCGWRTCEASVCGLGVAEVGVACSESGGQVCDGLGACVECVGIEQCAEDELCVEQICVSDTCSNGVSDGTETDVDCGGVLCPACGDGLGCAAATDCASGFCPPADLVCCASACDASCEACLGAKTGAIDGACEPVTALLDPEDECVPGVCDGQGSCASCVYGWSVAAEGGTQDSFAEAVTVTTAGGAVLAGRIRGTVSLAGVDVTSVAAGRYSVVLAQLDPTGAYEWSHAFGNGTQDSFGETVAVDGAGNVVVAGRFRDAVDFGGGALASGAGRYSAFLAKYDASGTHLWSHAFGNGTQDTFGEAVAVDAAGNVVLVGRLRDSVDFGGGPITNAGRYAAFVAKFDADGAHEWSQAFGNGTQDTFGEAVAVDTAGNVVLGGRFRDTVSFGGSDLTNVGRYAAFVVKLGPNGAHEWSRAFGNTTHDSYAQGVAADGAGSVLVTGRCDGAVDFGGGAVPAFGAGQDIYLVKLDASGGYEWSKRFGHATGDEFAEAVAADAAGNVVVTGRLVGAVDFGDVAPVNAGVRYDIFFAQYDSSGAHVCSRTLGNETDDSYGQAVGLNATGAFAIAGRFTGQVDFGGGAITAADPSAFVARFF